MDALRGYSARAIVFGLAIGLAVLAVRDLRRSRHDADRATTHAQTAADRARRAARASAIEAEQRIAELMRELGRIETRVGHGFDSYHQHERDRILARSRLDELRRERARILIAVARARARAQPLRVSQECLTNVLCR